MWSIADQRIGGPTMYEAAARVTTPTIKAGTSSLFAFIRLSIH